jgi:hypothetical protein
LFQALLVFMVPSEQSQNSHPTLLEPSGLVPLFNAFPQLITHPISNRW